MFYFLVPGLMAYNVILIIAAVIPAVILLFTVYKSDKLEKESGSLLWKLIVSGVISALIALVLERVFSLPLMLVEDPLAYNIILYFIIVAFSEEGAKYLMLYLRTWKNPEFNCQFDGVVYAVFVSLGFAIWENISYVLHYGFTTALVRAVTAIPGHASFAVFMGIFYGIARRAAAEGKASKKKLFQILAVIIPALVHGTYDFIASTASSIWIFIIFIVIMFVIAFVLVRTNSKKDSYF